MDKRDMLKALLLGVQSDLASLRQLRAILQAQRSLLFQHAGSELAPLNERHAELVAKLEHNARLRTRYLQQMGFKANAGGMSHLLAHLPAAVAQRLAPQWEQLHRELRELKLENDINGRILAGQQEVIRQLLGAETGDYSNLAG
jgi:flagella synthesis protein FlgN